MILPKPHVWEKHSSSVMPKVLLSNQIPGFFDHQYLWKESIGILDFLHGDNHQRKVASETTTLGWMRSVGSLIQLECRIL